MLASIAVYGQEKQNFDTEKLLAQLPTDVAHPDTTAVDDSQKDAKTLRKERNTFEFGATAQASATTFDNWAPGGQNTVSGRATLLVKDQYKKGKLAIINQFDSRYGVNIIDNEMYKNEDEFKYFFLTSYKMAGNWSYAFTVNLRSQYAKGYEKIDSPMRNSSFMAPGYIDVAMGFTYNKAPWTITLSPAAASVMTVLDKGLSAQGLNGITPGHQARTLFGSSVKVDFDKTFFKTMRYRSSFYSFCDYNEAPNARWENTLSFAAGKFLTASAYWLLYYDPYATTPMPKKLQSTYTVGVGLAYTFKNK